LALYCENPLIEGVHFLAEQLDNAIRKNAEGPARVSGDAGTVEQHKLSEQIEADRYLESRKASRAKGLGVKLAKISPGGTV
jgi:hypothetical protein